MMWAELTLPVGPNLKQLVGAILHSSMTDLLYLKSPNHLPLCRTWFGSHDYTVGLALHVIAWESHHIFAL